ncbi:uncharacterized protein LOC126712740 [Quercus robur]|uniref:uncharacterized protein LOC126712740 n=1 Tax=Quercus robur TaxID=38942 RepID=UPI002162464D|nr:uncharacterized protein LOC126712740 [Quercus robur]
MAGKGKSLKELMTSRGKGQSSKVQPSKGPSPSKVKTLPPVVPQGVSDPGLKVIPDLKKKRPVDTPEEGEVAVQPTKQQKTTRAPRSRRGTSSDSRDEGNLAEVRTSPRPWDPKLELDGLAIPYTASVREYNRGRAGYVAEVLEQPLLLPRDMEAYRRCTQSELFLSLKRDLALITQQVFVAEEFCRNSRNLAEAETQARTEVEKALGSLKHDHIKLTAEFKDSENRRKSAEAGLKSAEDQAEDQRKQLYTAQLNLNTERQAVQDLKTALQKVEDELRRVKEDAQLIREAIEAEKEAARQLGAEETEARLSEEIPEVCRDYCSISWAHALDAAGVPADSALRLPESIFYPPEIRANPDEAQVASEQDLAVPDAILVPDVAKDPATDSTIEVPPPQPEQKEDSPAKA